MPDFDGDEMGGWYFGGWRLHMDVVLSLIFFGLKCKQMCSRWVEYRMRDLTPCTHPSGLSALREDECPETRAGFQ